MLPEHGKLTPRFRPAPLGAAELRRSTLWHARPEMRVPIQVLVYAVSRTRETPKVLLLRRTVRLGGFWQGVTGAPLDGESLNDAAIRELREETGFEANRIVDLKFSYSFPVSDE